MDKATSARLSFVEVSALRFAMCQHLAGSLFRPMAPPQPSAVTSAHEARFAGLIKAYSKDCTFRATGDWMIDAKTTLLCPPELTSVVRGADAPYTIASKIHGIELNDHLRPTIRTPLADQTDQALTISENESSAAFVALATAYGELVPGAPVLINAEVCQRGNDQPPSLFMTSQCTLVAGVPASAYGVVMGSIMIVYNGRGLLKALTDCLHALDAWGFEPAVDAHQFVFKPQTMGDANPLAKYESSSLFTAEVHI